MKIFIFYLKKNLLSSNETLNTSIPHTIEEMKYIREVLSKDVALLSFTKDKYFNGILFLMTDYISIHHVYTNKEELDEKTKLKIIKQYAQLIKEINIYIIDLNKNLDLKLGRELSLLDENFIKLDL